MMDIDLDLRESLDIAYRNRVDIPQDRAAGFIDTLFAMCAEQGEDPAARPKEDFLETLRKRRLQARNHA